MDYESIRLEPPLQTPNKFRTSKDWPQNAQIVFTNFHLKYTPDGDYALKDLTFKISPAERVGIVGRASDSGKSSIIPALYRFAINEGSIEIDDINIDTLGLHDLRRAFALIPQDPPLFSGTFRSNLDPFALKRDDEIWEALEEVEMKHAVTSLDAPIGSDVKFSVGERQLFYMARALLNKNKCKVVIVDEAVGVVQLE